MTQIYIAAPERGPGILTPSKDSRVLGPPKDDATPAICHCCDRLLRSEPGARPCGWLHCPACGPVYMPLSGRWVRVRVAPNAGLAAAQLLARIAI